MSAILAAMRGRYNPQPRDLNPFVGVGYGQKAQMELTPGPTYQWLEIKTNVAKEDVGRITMTLNGSEFVGVDAADLLMLDNHKQMYVEDGRILIYFSDPEARTRQGVRSGELVTLPTDLIMLYVELKSKVTAQVPTMTARAHVTPSQPVRYYLPKLQTVSWNAASAGDNTFPWLERDPRLVVRRLFLKGDINKVTILRDDTVEYERTRDDNAFDLKRRELIQQSGFYALDFMAQGFAEDGKFLTAANRLEFKVNKTTAGNIPVLIDSIQQVKALPQGQ